MSILCDIGCFSFLQYSVNQCRSPFAINVSMLLCHPTLPIITHKKETAYIPGDR